MADDLDSAGGRLRWARERTGIDAAAMARAEGLNDKTYRAYENNQNGYAKRAADFAKRLNVPLEWLLSGGPMPETRPPEIVDVTIETNARLAPPMEGASLARMKRDVPIYGTALGADEVIDGEAIEQTTLNTAEIIGFRRRPVLLDGRADVYSLYVQGNSMHPRHRDGAVLFVEGRRAPSSGDDAVIYLRMADGEDDERPSMVMVKTLVRKSASFVELEQYTPPRIFRVPMERIVKMHRVLTLDELTD